MLIRGDKEYRNLQEQVLKNKDDIYVLQQGKTIAELGISVMNSEKPLASAELLPNAATYEGKFGDAYIVGTEAPFLLYVFSRSSDPNLNGFWFNWGPLNAPSVVPGPIGPQGIQGEQGIRGSFWYTQSGAPTNTVGVNENDQALDGLSGDTYQFVSGAWQLTGNIRGPQGIQGIQGLTGATGPQGLQGPQGPQGPQGQFIQIVGELQNTDQLPMVDSVPRYSAYLIPGADAAQHVWLIIGEGTTANPNLWHDAGAFGGGTTVLVDGVAQFEVDVKNISVTPYSYTLSTSTDASIGADGILFSGLQAGGSNISGQPLISTANIKLPIIPSGDINIVNSDVDYANVTINGIGFTITEDAWTRIRLAASSTSPEEVHIRAPSTSTNGQLTAAQLQTLLKNKGAYLMFNNEIYRLQGANRTAGYLVYSHLGYENTTAVYKIKCITITASMHSWVLTERTVVDPNDIPAKKYVHNISVYDTNMYVRFTIINSSPTPITTLADAAKAVHNINPTSPPSVPRNAWPALGYNNSTLVTGVYEIGSVNLRFRTTYNGTLTPTGTVTDDIS